MADIHNHYAQLSYNQKAFVDEVFEFAFREAKSRQIPLHGDDNSEFAVDALARLVLVSDENDYD